MLIYHDPNFRENGNILNQGGVKDSIGWHGNGNEKYFKSGSGI